MSQNEIFLIFLRYCLADKAEVPSVVSHINWKTLLKFAQKQAIAGIFAHKILEDNEQLHRASSFLSNRPSEDDVMDWMGVLTLIKNRNIEANKLCVKTTSNFSHEGFETCVLKGQGNNLLYPNFYIRTSGDIDIWTLPKLSLKQKLADESGFWKRLVLSDRMITFNYVRKLFPKAKFKCHHIEFNVWKNIPVEVHFYPMYLENFFSNKTLQSFFRNQRNIQFSHKVMLPETTEEVSIPTPFFNAIYQLTHINVHLLIEGIGLRQFVDYYYVLKHTPKEDHAAIRRLLYKMNLSKLAAAVLWIETEVLGLSSEYIYIEPDEKRGRKLLKEIQIVGNFGQYDTRMRVENEGFWHKQIRKTIQHSKFLMDYPSEEFCEPFFRLFHYIWRQWYNLKWWLFFT